MKLGLLTFHNAANYGASLQAYALQKFLSDKGYYCEYINYVNASRAHEYSMLWHIWDSLRRRQLKSAVAYILGSPFLTLRKIRFNKFYKQYLHKTEKVYHNSTEATSLNESFDRFIVGSDQVWNPTCNGYDCAFLLDFVMEKSKKISYSPSFGVAAVPKVLEADYRKYLFEFGFLGVREMAGKSIVKELTGREATVNIDPVMLISKEQWMSILPKKKHKERFIFFYTNCNNQIADFFKTGYHLEGRKQYVLSRYTRPQDFLNPAVRVKYCMSPQEFVWVILNAELVISASFHCIAMAILLNRPFITILTGDKGKDERIVNLLKMTGLTGRILSEKTNRQMIEAPIQWEFVNDLIIKKREQSADYLFNAINSKCIF